MHSLTSCGVVDSAHVSRGIIQNFNMNHSRSALFTLLCLIQVLGRSCSDPTDQRQVLTVLNLVSESTVASGATYAARLAVEQINNRSDLLQGYRVELVEAASDECGVDTASAAGLGYEEGLVSFVKNAVHSTATTDWNVVGVVGLLCSAVTDGLSPVIGRKGSDLIQISGSTSPTLRDSYTHPRLYRVTSSAAIYADVVVELMKQVGWTRISEVHDFHHIATTEFLINKVFKSGLQIPYTSLYFPGHQSIECILQDFSETGSTILYVSFSQSHDIADLLCSAYASKMTWPRYLYLVPNHSPSDVLNSISMTGGRLCNQSLLVKSMEGVVFLNYDLEQSADVILVSGESYRDYKTELGLTGQALWHGNVLFDEVWSLALALNKTNRSISLANYQAKSGAIADEVEEALGKTAFQGATGIIQFNTDKEVTNVINIHDSNGRLLVQYTKDGYLSILTHEIFPTDFHQEVQVIDSWVSMVIFIVCGLSYGLTTLNLIILFYYKKEKELKATSPYLSLIMFFACYNLYTAALFRNINKSFVIESDTLFATLCIAEIWMGTLGYTMIFSTLFALLLRILYLFNYFGKTGKYWADKYLAFAVLLMTSVSVVILSIWTGIHRPEKVTIELIPPERVTTLQCDGKYLGLWLAGLFTYGGIIMSFVSIFACANRKIKRSEFKDTKKVNFYIYLIFIVITIVMPTWYILRVSRLFTLAHLALCTGFISVGILCQLILYVPKTLPVWWRNLTGRSSSGATQNICTTDNQYSKVWV